MMKQTVPLAALVLACAAPAAFAHGDAVHKTAAPISTEEHEFGKEGVPAKVTRTIDLDMSDMMKFGPANVVVRQGETIRFVVKNNGRMMHEAVIGTLAELKQHGEMMKKHPGMEHDAPYMAHVRPGKKEEIVWHFTQPGEFRYACLIPGHMEAGMIGTIKVVAR